MQIAIGDEAERIENSLENTLQEGHSRWGHWSGDEGALLGRQRRRVPDGAVQERRDCTFVCSVWTVVGTAAVRESVGNRRVEKGWLGQFPL